MLLSYIKSYTKKQNLRLLGFRLLLWNKGHSYLLVQLSFISWGHPRKPVIVHSRLPAEQPTRAQRWRGEPWTRYVGWPWAGQKERKPARARVHHGLPVKAGRARRLGSAVRKQAEGEKNPNTNPDESMIPGQMEGWTLHPRSMAS